MAVMVAIESYVDKVLKRSHCCCSVFAFKHASKVVGHDVCGAFPDAEDAGVAEEARDVEGLIVGRIEVADAAEGFHGFGQAEDGGFGC